MKDQSSSPPVSQPLPSIPSLAVVSFRIGTDNAPFHVISKIQTTKISLNPTHSEYNAFSITTENIKFYRTYLAWLGYPQKDPTL
jgi:hypothetical protein